jgi:hypothetical protein
LPQAVLKEMTQSIFILSLLDLTNQRPIVLRKTVMLQSNSTAS